jgi:serine/threonine protein kinase
VSEDLTGRRLGHYRIDGVLGKGGMSVLYKATDIRLGRKVALKVIAEHITSDPEFRERFVDEARNTSAVDHSNVVPLYDFGEVDGLLYIAMRLVDGSDLASLISAGPLAAGRAVALLGQIADALDMLHGRGLVHLDVKPANVLVTTREAAGEHVYLADFGLTRRGATGHRTRGGDFLGSPNYAAPEHLRGEPVDARTDVYSLACVLYTCVTGRPPYGGSVPEVIQGHLGGEPPRAPVFDEVIRKGMAKSPGERYGSCKELIIAAREALAPGRAPLTPPPGVPWQQPVRPVPQGHPPTPPPNQLPPNPPGYGGYAAGSNTPSTDPVRLRPPVPAHTEAFADERTGRRRWVLPVLLLAIVVAAVLLALAIFAGAGQDDSGSGGAPGPATGPTTGPTAGPNTPATRLSSLPNVPVGPGENDSRRPLPTSVPIQPR